MRHSFSLSLSKFMRFCLSSVSTVSLMLQLASISCELTAPRLIRLADPRASSSWRGQMRFP